MKTIWFAVWLLIGTSFAEETPKTMTKVEVVLQSPDVRAGSFASKPKTMYRAGSRYCRTEELPDPENGIHGLMIINEPDYWMINLLTKTARHGVDSGPTFNCRLPIFPEGALKASTDDDKKILDLEFGRELEFFRNRGAASKQGPVLQTKQTIAYTLEIGSLTLGLFTYGTPERPVAVLRQKNNKSDIFWYSGYGQLDFDPKLFAKPENVKIEEMKP